MNSIPCTQYVRPRGLTKKLAMEDVPDSTYQHARYIMQAGLVFETEVMMSGEISLTITDKTKEEDVAIQFAQNIPGNVRPAFYKLIDDYYEKHKDMIHKAIAEKEKESK